MIKVILLIFILSKFLFAGDLANKKEFMKMCNNPTPSQKITFEALAKDNRVKIDEQMCAYLYSKTGRSGFSPAYDATDTTKITDLSPLQFFLDLESLRLPLNKVKDISILKYLTKLKDLDLSDNPVSDLSPLKGLKHLKALNLYSTQVTDLSAINNIKTLQRLSYGYMKNIDTIDISQIKDLINLEYLSLGDLKVKNFNMINNFINLTSFRPPRTTILEDISSLTNLKKLERLDLGNAKFITNIDFVVNFSKLSSLSIDNTNVENIDILKNVQTLKYLNIKNTKVRDASAITGRQDFTLSAYDAIFFNSPFTRFEEAPLRWCSPKNSKDVKEGKSCFEKDGKTLKPWWKRMLGI